MTGHDPTHEKNFLFLGYFTGYVHAGAVTTRPLSLKNHPSLPQTLTYNTFQITSDPCLLLKEFPLAHLLKIAFLGI